MISLYGASKGRETPYEGPTFPPTNVQSTGDNRGAPVLKEKSVDETVEEKALEW